MKMKKIASVFLALALALSMAACSSNSQPLSESAPSSSSQIEAVESASQSTPEPTLAPTPNPTEEPVASVSLNDIPAYNGEPYAVINDNVPFFAESDLTTDVFETYSPLDSLGRCGVAYANICVQLMPTEDRESISEVKPSGWVNNSYDIVDGGYLYNRCHLIGFQLAGENANEENLITGTRYLNTEGMLPFENMVADYVKETENHVLYRVTPVFDGNNLVASGVLMEAESVEDKGEGVQFCVYCYNVQPGIHIDYATGDNYEEDGKSAIDEEAPSVASDSVSSDSGADAAVAMQDYVLNTNTLKFHLPGCRSVKQMSEKNRQDVKATRDELIARGYEPCKICNP